MPSSLHLCQLAQDWDGQVPGGGMMAERKHDGFRCLWFRGIDGIARLWTRNGMPIGGCEHIAHRMRQIEEAAGAPMFIDGELVVDGTLAATKAWAERGWSARGEAGIFHAFDIMPDADWRAGGCRVPLHERKAQLGALIQASAGAWTWRERSHGHDKCAPAVQIVDDVWVFDHADVMDFARRLWAFNAEGAMIKDPLAPYRRARCTAWQKVKRDTPAARAATTSNGRLTSGNGAPTERSDDKARTGG